MSIRLLFCVANLRRHFEKIEKVFQYAISLFWTLFKYSLPCLFIFWRLMFILKGGAMTVENWFNFLSLDFCPECRSNRLSEEAHDSKMYRGAPIFIMKRVVKSSSVMGQNSPLEDRNDEQDSMDTKHGLYGKEVVCLFVWCLLLFLFVCLFIYLLGNISCC